LFELFFNPVPEAEDLIDHVCEVDRIVVPRDLVILASLIQLSDLHFNLLHYSRSELSIPVFTTNDIRGFEFEMRN
jgi:hypothetical protein